MITTPTFSSCSLCGATFFPTTKKCKFCLTPCVQLSQEFSEEKASAPGNSAASPIGRVVPAIVVPQALKPSRDSDEKKLIRRHSSKKTRASKVAKASTIDTGTENSAGSDSVVNNDIPSSKHGSNTGSNTGSNSDEHHQRKPLSRGLSGPRKDDSDISNQSTNTNSTTTATSPTAEPPVKRISLRRIHHIQPTTTETTTTTTTISATSTTATQPTQPQTTKGEKDEKDSKQKKF